jgi:phosphate starvation-inducible protein PhoH
MGANSNKKRNVPFKEQFKKIEPLTKNQSLAFSEFGKGQNLILHGFAGTGKTLCAMYLALDALFKGDCTNIIIVRSAVATQDIGFLPGTYEEKIAPYEEPYDSICDFLFNTK